MTDVLSQPGAGPLTIGGAFLKYEIKGLIGRGGHAWVYEGYDAFADRSVAIKVLHREGGVSADMLRRGQAEAQILSRVDHPNVVRVHDAGVASGMLYLVMERLRGLTLRGVLEEHGPLEPTEACSIVLQMADGVQCVHAQQVIHRDLKPENTLLVKDNQPKVLDFGIAKVVNATAMNTQKDLVLGTLLYMSPEQVQNGAVTVQVDVYAMGLILSELLLGKHLLSYLPRMANASLWEVAHLIVSRIPPRLHELDPRIDPELSRIVFKALTKRPEQRHQGMQHFASELRDCLQTLKPSAPPRSLWLKKPTTGVASQVRENPYGKAAYTVVGPRAMLQAVPNGLTTEQSGAPSFLDNVSATLPAAGIEAPVRPALRMPAPGVSQVTETLGSLAGAAALANAGRMKQRPARRTISIGTAQPMVLQQPAPVFVEPAVAAVNRVAVAEINAPPAETYDAEPAPGTLDGAAQASETPVSMGPRGPFSGWSRRTIGVVATLGIAAGAAAGIYSSDVVRSFARGERDTPAATTTASRPSPPHVQAARKAELEPSPAPVEAPAQPPAPSLHAELATPPTKPGAASSAAQVELAATPPTRSASAEPAPAAQTSAAKPGPAVAVKKRTPAKPATSAAPAASAEDPVLRRMREYDPALVDNNKQFWNQAR